MSELIEDKLASIRKQKEIQDIALSILPIEMPKRGEIASQLLDSFVQVTPPLKSGPIFEMRMLTISSEGLNGGKSVKPGNIYLNFEKLLKLVPDIVLTIASLSGNEWILFFAALKIWSTIWRESTIVLDHNHAMAIYAMWKNKDSRNQISEDDAFSATNLHLSKYGMPLVSRRQFAAIIDNLCKMECIELNEGIVWLREWVKTTY